MKSLTYFFDENGQEFLVMYRMPFGSPKDHGADIGRILNGLDIVYTEVWNRKVAFGMHCLAAQVVAKLKSNQGGVLLYPPGTQDIGEDFIYVIEPCNGRPKITIKDPKNDDEVVFEGTPEELLALLAWICKTDN